MCKPLEEMTDTELLNILCAAASEELRRWEQRREADTIPLPTQPSAPSAH